MSEASVAVPVIAETTPAVCYVNADPLHGRRGLVPAVPIGTVGELHQQIDNYANDSQIVAAVHAVTDSTCLVELTVQTVDNSAHSTAWLQLPVPPGTRVTNNAADAIPKPTPQLVDGFPRRSRRNCWSEVETLIRSAMQAVEAMPAHPWLTDAVSLLAQAYERVADFQELTPETLTTPETSLDIHASFPARQITDAEVVAPVPLDGTPVVTNVNCIADGALPVETSKLAHVTTEQLIDYGQQIHRSSTTLLALNPGTAFLLNGKPAIYRSRQGYQITYEQDGVEHTGDIDQLPLTHVLRELTTAPVTTETEPTSGVFDFEFKIGRQDADVDRLGQATVDCLNSALKADPAAIAALIANRIPCNNALADHPYVVVDEAKLLPPGQAVVGAIGLLNGVLMANGLPAVAWMTSDCGGRNLLTGFTTYKQPVAAVQPASQN